MKIFQENSYVTIKQQTCVFDRFKKSIVLIMFCLVYQNGQKQGQISKIFIIKIATICYHRQQSETVIKVRYR